MHQLCATTPEPPYLTAGLTRYLALRCCNSSTLHQLNFWRDVCLTAWVKTMQSCSQPIESSLSNQHDPCLSQY